MAYKSILCAVIIFQYVENTWNSEGTKLILKRKSERKWNLGKIKQNENLGNFFPKKETTTTQAKTNFTKKFR